MNIYPTPSHREMALLRKVFDSISQTFDLNRILESVVSEVGLHFRLDRCQIIKCNPDSLLIQQQNNPQEDISSSFLSVLVESVTEYRSSGHLTPVKLEQLPFESIYHYFETLIISKDDTASKDQSQYLDICGTGWHKVLPIMYRGIPYGIIWLHINKDSDNKIPSNHDLSLVKDIGSYVGSAIHQKNLLQKEEKAKRQAEEANRRKNMFLANISHELRTPLNSIIAGSALMKDGALGDINEKQEHYAGLIEGQGNYLLAMINELLDFSKMEAGKIQLHIKNINTLNFINETLDTFKPLLTQKNQQFVININPNIPAWMDGDEIRLRQVLVNILSNAHKYSPENTTINFNCDCQEDEEGNQSLILSIRDEGMGIDEHEISRIFEPFEQVNLKDGGSKKNLGTGLGLSIAKSIIDLHHGTITVTSKPNQGSNFQVTLPQLQTKQAPIAKAQNNANEITETLPYSA